MEVYRCCSAPLIDGWEIIFNGKLCTDFGLVKLDRNEKQEEETKSWTHAKSQKFIGSNQKHKQTKKNANINTTVSTETDKPGCDYWKEWDSSSM